MNLKDSTGEDGENERHAFVLSLLKPISSEAILVHQERARQAALAGLSEAIGNVARCELHIEEVKVARETYGRAWRTLISLNVADPSTNDILLRLAAEIRTANTDLVRALIFPAET